MEKKLKFDADTIEKINQKISYIDGFKGIWFEVERNKGLYLKELRHIATIESVGSSTRIEGSVMTDGEVGTLMKNIKITPFTSRDEQEVGGYFETLELIFENYQDIKISRNDIMNLHGILLKHSSKDEFHKGKYKILSNSVVKTFPDGNKRLIFNPTSPHLTEVEMDKLLTWTNKKLEKAKVHPLIVIAAFIYEFLSIHPFQDGNGRLSRLLTTLLLLQNGYDFVEYVSFEHLIEKRKTDYYKALINAQSKRSHDKDLLDEWILFFLSSLESMIKKLSAKYDQLNSLGAYLNDRQKRIRSFITKRAPIGLADLRRQFPHVSEPTLKKDLQYLTAQNMIERLGQSRATVYINMVEEPQAAYGLLSKLE